MMLRSEGWQPRVIQLEKKKFKGNPRVHRSYVLSWLCTSWVFNKSVSLLLTDLDGTRGFCAADSKLNFFFFCQIWRWERLCKYCGEGFCPLHLQQALGFKFFNDVTNCEDLLFLLLSITFFKGIEISKYKTLLPMNLVSTLKGKSQGKVRNWPTSLSWIVKFLFFIWNSFAGPAWYIIFLLWDNKTQHNVVAEISKKDWLKTWN